VVRAGSNALKRIAALIVGLSIGLLLTEGLLHVLPSPLRNRLTRELYIEQRHLMQEEFCEEDPDPDVGWHNIPGHSGIFENREFKTTVHMNSLGLRGPEINLRAPGRRRILLLGDSVTVGWGVNDDETFAALLQSRHANWDVLNGGVAGYSTRNEWGLLRQKGQPTSCWFFTPMTQLK
jgi:hypothetical protein